jgi:two-component system sensor histidine kinase AlgZ
VADRTIEKLADVFRYALRGSEREWALLDEELEFVRAYLDVEQARFGARLRAEVALDDDVSGGRVPTMMVQTLVENAVKHGAAAVRGQASVRVLARREGDRLQLTVEDNGPGFEPASPGHASGTRRGGYGLAHIRQRLHGHFGSGAELSIARDDRRAVTIVSIMLPFLREEPRSVAAATAAGQGR